MTPDEFVQELRKERATAILRTNDAATARKAMDAAIQGGFRIVEFTLTIPNVFELIREFSQRPNLIVGAGTVLTAAQAKEAVRSGARFLVSPITDEAVIGAARELNVASIPGAFTPTEMVRADRAGAPLVKLFPSPGDGPTYVRQILGPLPHLKIVPTAGVDEKNAAAYFKAGVWAVGFVSSLFSPEDLGAGRYEGIEERARRLRAVVAAA